MTLNDNFADARPVVLSGQDFNDTQDSTGFTRETGEPQVFGNRDTDMTAWWVYTPANDTVISVDTAGSYSLSDPSYGDTVLGVYTGSDVASLTTVAENDDDAPATGGPSLPYNSALTFTATAGVTYYFQVGTYSAGDTTFYYFHLNDPGRIPPPPPPPRPPDYPRRSFARTW